MLGLVVELLTRRRIFVPILRVTAIEPNAVTLNTGNVSLRRFAQRPGEVLVLGQVLETHVRVNDPELPQLAAADVVVVDLGIEQTAKRPANAIGRERLLQGLRLQQHGKASQRAFGDRRGGERGERRPEMLLGHRIDCHAFVIVAASERPTESFEIE